MRHISARNSILLGIALATFSSASHAYLDPGTASIILQGTIAAIAGAAVTIRLYWYRIKALFSKPSQTDIETRPEGNSDQTKDGS